MNWFRNFFLTLAWLALSTLAAASPYRGVVTYGGLPLPGATITATQGTKTLTAVSDQDGAFQFDDLADGQWTIQISMQLFATLKTDVTIAPNMPGAKFEMKLLPEGQILAESQTATQPVEIPPAPAPTLTKRSESQPADQKSAQANAQSAAPEMPKPPSEQNEQSADGFLVQGSVNNAATSLYATNPAFGNTRAGSRALYTGGFRAIEGNSALNARQYALSGIEAAKPAFNDFTGVASSAGADHDSRAASPRAELFCHIPVDAEQHQRDQHWPGADAGGTKRQPRRIDECAWATGNGLQSRDRHAVRE